MQWILMLIGGFLGALENETILGAMLGLLVGFAIVIQQLKSKTAKLQAALKTQNENQIDRSEELRRELQALAMRQDLRTEGLLTRLKSMESARDTRAPASTAASHSQAAVSPAAVLPPTPVPSPIPPVVVETPKPATISQPAIQTPVTARVSVPPVTTPTPTTAATSTPAPAPAPATPTPTPARSTAPPLIPLPPRTTAAATTTATTATVATATTTATPSPAPLQSIPSTLPTQPVRKAPAAPVDPSAVEGGILAAQNWLFGGNTVVRIGVLLLFIGLAFLLRYASERISIPVEVRYASVALAAIALLVVGWRLREKRSTYALMLQGTGIAVLYLTIFAALRLHPLLSASAALALLVVVTTCLAMLAVLQNSLSLAAVAVLGGFAAPILTSSGSGNHVALFSYFALLNAGIFAIAWFKAWRLLNLIGFVGTFGIGTTWGLRSYKPELFASTEPFLILFFLMYVGIGLLFARRKLLDAQQAPEDRNALLRWSAKQADYIDATVLFGPPLIGFGLQCAVVDHLEFGSAFSALALGLFYMVLAFVVRARPSANRTSLLMEVCLALGVIFGTLAIPLGLDARWTSAAWAVEGAGIYWLGLHQHRRVARYFALFLQVCAAFFCFGELRTGTVTLLAGSTLGVFMIGAAMLFSFWQLRRAMQPASTQGTPPLAESERAWKAPLACVGLAFLYLIAPLNLQADSTAIAWAGAGLITLFVGLRLPSRSFLCCAFAIQVLGAALFYMNLEAGDGQGSVLASGWQGLMNASLIGLLLIGSVTLAVRDPLVKESPVLMNGLSMILLIALFTLNLAVLFVLPWRTASAVWAGSGLLILWLSLLLRMRSSFLFALALQAIGGTAFLLNSGDTLRQALQNTEGLRPLMHSGFWTPLVFSVTALIGAWRLHRASNAETQQWISSPILRALSNALLIWGAGWWTFCAASEIVRFVPIAMQDNLALTVAAASVLLWMLLAMRERWQELATLCLLLTPYAVLALLNLWQTDYRPFAELGWLAWPLWLAVHLISLRQLATLVPAKLLSAAHVLGCWLLLTVLSLELCHFFAMLADQYNAWRWLGWALVPSAYLLLVASNKRLPWPVRSFPREYKILAATPVVAILLMWFWFANLQSSGSAQPLPYLPIVNPLEIGLLLVLFALYRWSDHCITPAAENLRDWNQARHVIAGASLFAVLTMTVCRTVHQYFNVPFDANALGNSMLVQAGLSLVWTICALALMIAGTRLLRRNLWMVGATLVGIVVVKLFFVELGNSGSLERIISFIGVGVLLLFVGYFSPLPPRRVEATPKSEPEVTPT